MPADDPTGTEISLLSDRPGLERPSDDRGERRPARRLLSGSLPIILICCAALALRLFGLETKALWSDEMCRVTWSKGYEFDRTFGVFPDETGIRMPSRTVRETLEVASHHTPPLYMVLMNLWSRSVGDSGDLVVRLPSALLSTGAVLVLFLALRMRFGRSAALLAAAFTALSPFHVFYAQEANHYALAFLLVSLSFLFYFRLLTSGSSRDGILWAIASLAAVYTHYYCGIVTLFQWLTLVWPYRLSWRAHLPPALLVAAGFAPYLPAVRRQLPGMTSAVDPGGFLGAPYFFASARTHLVQPFLGALAEWVSWAVALLFIALSLALVVAAVRRSGPVDGRGLLINLLGPALFVYALFWIFRTNPILWPRYQLFFGFTFAALSGIALASFGPWARTTSAALLVVFGLVAARQTDIVREDWRTAAAVIDRSATPGEPVFVYRSNLVYSLARYLRGESQLFGIEPSADLESLLAAVLEANAASDGAWYASAWPEPNGIDQRVRSYLEATHLRCAPQEVDPGWYSLRLIHCTGHRPPAAHPDSDAADVVEPSWRTPRSGPRLEAAWLDTYGRASATGWAWSTSGLRRIRVVLDGATIAEFPHPGLERPDVAAAFPAAPAELASRSGFRIAIAPGAGDIRRMTIVGVRADDTLMEITKR